jgi:hypothetical protein
MPSAQILDITSRRRNSGVYELGSIEVYVRDLSEVARLPGGSDD